MNYVTGAGVLLINNIDNKPCVILARDKYSKSYMDFGGGVDNYKKHQHNRDIKKTAVRELYEESLGLFKIKVKYISNKTKLKHEYHKSFYKSFPLYITNNISEKLYYKNLELLSSDKETPRYYKESDHINWFYLSDLYNKNYIDINGDKQKLKSRAVEVIQGFLKKYYNSKTDTVSDKIIRRTVEKKKVTEDTFLYGTKYYKISE